MLAQNVVPVDANNRSAGGRNLQWSYETYHSVSAFGLSMGTLTGASIIFCFDFSWTWSDLIVSVVRTRYLRSSRA